MEIFFEEDKEPEVYERSVEIVERKGLGHPDSICDALAEEVSLALSQYYLHNFGKILHHNVDKVLLVGGEAEPKFGGGYLIQPIRIIVAGRLTYELIKNSQRYKIPFGILIRESVIKWFTEKFRFLDPSLHLTIDYKVGPGSLDLKSLCEDIIPLANDTSIGIGYAPLSPLEKIVLEIENFLNSPAIKKSYPAVGEDIKVLGVRKEEKIDLTVASAMVGHLISSSREYLNLKEELSHLILRRAKELAPDYKVNVFINTGDNPEKNLFYLTVTGTSAEHGDDGATGRGNRVNGLITPSRPMTMEATAGKNPVNHVGKIYNVLARDLAESLYQQLKDSGVKGVYCMLVSQIGKPINRPHLIHLRLKMFKDCHLPETLKSEAIALTLSKLDNIEEYTRRILNREFRLF